MDDPIFYYHMQGILPDNNLDARRIVIKASNYGMVDRWLYRRAYLQPWLKCITWKEGMNVLHEIHEGICGTHEVARTTTRKAFQQGLFWPIVIKDARELVKKMYSMLET